MSGSARRMAPERVVELLGVRGALREYRYFVGQRELLLRLGTCTRSGQRGLVWMFGPRRMGKSTLAAKLVSEIPPPMRSIWVDAIDLPPQDFDGLLDRVITQSGEVLSDATPRARFETLVAGSAARPLTIVFDEFDRIAAELREDQQGFLRRLNQVHPELSYVFITRTDPHYLVEEVSDASSRLMGICQALRVRPLEEQDVEDLFRRVADDLGNEAIRPLARRAWSLVGGYPVAVAMLAQTAAAEAVARGDRCTDDDLLDSFERARAEVKGHLERLWRDLPPRMRMLLGREPGPLIGDDRTEALTVGFWSRRVDLVRPEWLLEIGGRLGVAPEAPNDAPAELVVNVERLHALVYAINMHLQRLGYPRGFVSSEEITRQYLLTRDEGTRESLAHAIGHLTKVLFTAAGRPRDAEGDGGTWRLLPRLVDAWGACDGYRDLVALGDFAEREGAVPADAAVRDASLEREGSVFVRHCGTRQPATAAHWLKIRDGVIRSLVRSLEVLEQEAMRLSPAGQVASDQGPSRTGAAAAPNNRDDDRLGITIGIVTALAEEFAAMKATFEACQDDHVPGSGAGRRYVLGTIASRLGGEHRVALALAGMGNNMAAARATLLRQHYRAVEAIIMVGIAGAVPAPHKSDAHVRLGDIVISDKRGVVQYDMVKLEEICACRVPPSATLLEAVQFLQVGELEGRRPWEDHIEGILRQLQQARPRARDMLHASDDPTQPVKHPRDPRRREGVPRVFLGPVASANELLRNPVKRDALRDRFGVKAVEMEGSGIADATWNHSIGYLVVRGTCDYCDSHKNDDWREYAAAVAAGYTKALIESIPAT